MAASAQTYFWRFCPERPAILSDRRLAARVGKSAKTHFSVLTAAGMLGEWRLTQKIYA